MNHTLFAALRYLAVAAFLYAAPGCSGSLIDAYTSASPPSPGHVYLFRGLIGEVFSRGLDNLADQLTRRGVAATVHGLSAYDSVADEIITNFKADPLSGPVILIGHSSGGDAIITMAEKLNAANVPVGLAFGFDPTPVAGRLPGNIELFVNLFQKTNPIGGGTIKPGPGFRGRLINVDLREHTEIIHITLDKSPTIHEVVANLIVDFVAHERAKQAPPARSAAAGKSKRYEPMAAPNFLSPFLLSYVVPRDQPIEIWDSGFEMRARPGETLAAVAAANQVPVWLLAAANNREVGAAFAPGTPLIIPYRMYRAATHTAAQ
jgi:hypothetical protein